MDMENDSHGIARQAEAFFVRRHRETPSERQSRESWLAADPRHARAYAEVERMWEYTGSQRDAPDMQALRDQELAALRRPGIPRFRWPLAVAALLAVLAVGASLSAILMLGQGKSVTYATGLGERRTEVLADGSEAVLNTDSELVIHYTRRRREIELRNGEAQFQVAHDTNRPFVVRLGDSTVTALGTRFQVRHDSAATSVTLLEGSVEVMQGRQRRTLRPNEQINLSVDAPMSVRVVDADQATGWVDGWLQFENAPLGNVVAEANRYAKRKLRLGDTKLADMALSGDFRAGDSASIAAGITLILPVRVDEEGEDIVLLPR